MEHLLALDAGTGSGRAIIFDRDGRQLAAASREWSHPREDGCPGSLEFEREKNWRLLVDCIREASSRVSDLHVVGISATSMGEGLVLYDDAGAELWACSNVDARAIAQVQALRRRDPDLERRLYLRSGQTFALSAPPRLLWLKEHRPELYGRAVRVSMLSDWVSHRLGAPPVIDPSNGSTAGLFGMKTRQLDPAILESCGLDGELARTPVRECGAIIGQVSASCARATGLAAGTPIVMGGRDAQLGTIGVGAVAAGQACVFGGTFWQQEVNIDQPCADPTGRIRLNFHAVPGQWQAETIVFFPGMAVRWFRDAICPDIKAAALAEGSDPYAILEGMAAEVPAGSHDIIPVFSDAMDYSHWRHAAPSFLNLSLDPSRCSRAALFRALEENAAVVALANLRRIADVTGRFPASVIFASGASKGPLWCQILADVLQIPVHTRVVKEATALGAAMCAAVGVKLFSSFEEAVDRVVEEERRYEPDPRHRQVYEDLYGKWSAAYGPQLELANRGITEALWRAPGE